MWGPRQRSCYLQVTDICRILGRFSAKELTKHVKSSCWKVMQMQKKSNSAGIKHKKITKGWSWPCGMEYYKTAWHSGRTPVFDRRTFPVPLSTYSWQVTTYVGKPSAIGQPTRPTQPFIFSGSINWVVTNFIGCVLVAPSDECSRGWAGAACRVWLHFGRLSHTVYS